MPTMKFTARTIASLKPTGKVVEYYEAGRTVGTGTFGIRVAQKGKMRWFIMYKADGKQKRLSLGTYPEMSLSAARSAANDVISQKDKGHDPHTEKKRRSGAPTITDLWQEYQEVLSRRNKPKAPNTIRAENSWWERIIQPTIGDMRVEDVRPYDLSTMLNEYAKKSPIAANRMHALLSVMFKPAITNGWIDQHPLFKMDKPSGAEQPRKRVLSDDEIKTVWPEIDKLRRNPRDQIKLGLLTAARPGEIANMEWEDVDFENAIWSMPDTKTGNAFLCPLSQQVIEILQNRLANPGKRYENNPSKWVFPTAHNTGKDVIRPALSPIKACSQLRNDTGVEHFTPHDLRRTARTLMSRLEIEHHVRERVLNHSQGRIEAVYDQHDYLREKRAALAKLANEIDRITGKSRKTKKIVRLKTG